LPDGTTKSHEPGTWIVGIEWDPEPWQRVKAGDIEGLSIYGQAEQLPLERAATRKAFEVPLADETVVHVVYESQTAAEKASEQMGLEGAIHEHVLDGMDVFMPGATHDDFVEAYMDDADADSVTADTDTDAKEDEDPCWEGYTMVGTDENGDPNCVPSDEVPDATGFENALVRSEEQLSKPTTFDDEVPDDITDMSACIAWAEDTEGIDNAPAYCQAHNTGEKAASDGQSAATDAQTVKSENSQSTKQNAPMSDSSPDDGADPDAKASGIDTGALASEVASAVKDELPDFSEGTPASKVEADDVADEAAELADALGVPVADVMEQLDPMLDDQPEEMEAGSDEYDDEEDEEMEASAEKRADPNYAKGYSGEGVRKSEAEDGDDAVSENPLASREQAAKSWEAE